MAYKRIKEDELIKSKGQRSTLPATSGQQDQISTNPGIVQIPWNPGITPTTPTTPGVSPIKLPGTDIINPGIGLNPVTPSPEVVESMTTTPYTTGVSVGNSNGNANGVPGGFTGSSNGVNVNNATQEAIREQMNANSIAWWEADEEERAELEAANRALAALLGEGVTFDPETGYWTGTADGANYTASPNYGGDKPTYESQYTNFINQMMQQILNRDPFSYNYQEDPLYQQYAEMYTREGNRAMDDTLAEVASGAGGMNSYAVTAAQQANNYYMSQLGDKIPELQQLAYQMYMDEVGLDMDKLSMLMGLDDMYYGRHRDEVGDWYNDRDFEYGQHRDEVEDERYDQEWEYNTGLTDSEVAYERAWDLLNAGVMPDEELLAAAGISVEQATAILAGMSGSGSGSYTGSYTGNIVDDDDTGDSSIYQQMYDAGVRSEGDAYAWLVANGYNTTQAGKFAGYFTGWIETNPNGLNNSTGDGDFDWGTVAMQVNEYGKAGNTDAAMNLIYQWLPYLSTSQYNILLRFAGLSPDEVRGLYE